MLLAGRNTKLPKAFLTTVEAALVTFPMKQTFVRAEQNSKQSAPRGFIPAETINGYVTARPRFTTSPAGGTEPSPLSLYCATKTGAKHAKVTENILAANMATRSGAHQVWVTVLTPKNTE